MTKATSFTLEQLNQKQQEVHNVVTETVISERWFEAHSDADAQQELQRMRDGAIDWDLEQHDSEVVDETLYYCPDSGEGHEEVEI